MRRWIAIAILGLTLLVIAVSEAQPVPNTQQPADFIASFQDVLRRLDVLERYDSLGGGMKPLMLGAGQSTYGYVFGAPAEITAVRTATFTLSKATGIFVVPTMATLVTASGAGVSYVSMWSYVSNLDGSEAADTLGNAVISTATLMQVTPNGSIADTCHPYSANLPAGTYRLSMFGGTGGGSGATADLVTQQSIYAIGN